MSSTCETDLSQGCFHYHYLYSDVDRLVMSSAQLRQISSRVKQAGPGYEEAASLMRQAAEKLVAARIVAARRMGQPVPDLA